MNLIFKISQCDLRGEAVSASRHTKTFNW